MEIHPIPAKRPRISAEESTVDQQQQAEMDETSPQKRWLCNELVRELCLEIPTAKTSDRILLTARNMYAYLEPQFSKKLIYRDAIAFLKARLNVKKNIEIHFYQVGQNDESEPIVVLSQEQSGEMYKLETNHFRVRIQNNESTEVPCSIFVSVDQFENAHLHHFLCTIALLIHPIKLCLDYDWWDYPAVEELVHFMNTQSDWIDSIGLWNEQFILEPIYGALNKYNELEIYGTMRPPNVPKMIQWLTSKNNNNGQPKKKSLLLCSWRNKFEGGLALLMDELKKEFTCATSKSEFVVRVDLRQSLDEFTMCNELTGEKLQLRRKYTDEKGRYIHALSRSLESGLDDNENDCTDFEIGLIYLS